MLLPTVMHEQAGARQELGDVERGAGHLMVPTAVDGLIRRDVHVAAEDLGELARRAR